ncbi:hypothetical protein DFP72DRAFT_928890 [Ephemerocybe angulata]|uniref:Nephrocystin 3-like N-terminal domain-containing protein n=1 Tax=Ephemerocybe angulata TaxID=980116 RepID=A0A8H6HDP4_9AGAR|nr:hypothetical protein DFP72DRAFT_928890 [Tulosesus angulatus]
MCFSHLWRRGPKIQVEEWGINASQRSKTSPTQHPVPYLPPSHQPLRTQASGSIHSQTPVDTGSSRDQDRAPYPLSIQPQPSNTSVPSTNVQSRPPRDSSEQNLGTTFLANASNFHMENLNYTSNHYAAQKQGNVGWEYLLKAMSTNALHNSMARFDPPKCDANTRVELIHEISTWIEDRNAPTQFLCMTGAAGSGKSALQQTVAEGCVAKGILAASFFFNTADNTRNNVSTIIPTLAYQLGQKSAALRQMIGVAVENDAVIFDQSLKTQIEKLILDPVSRLPPSELASLPYAILIDGLDECTKERDQRALLCAIHDTFLHRRSIFRIFLASRPELAIFEALEPGGHLHEIVHPIRLSDDYDATSDIRLTVRRNFTEIGLRRRWEHAWFTEEDVEAIVAAASGQYIYAATVIRYVSEPRRSPVERLRTILASQSGTDHGTKPFALLDLLYTLVLTTAKEGYEAIDNRHDFLLILRVYLAINAVNLNLCISRQDKLLGLEEGTYESILCDLRSLLVALPNSGHGPGGISRIQIKVYHKSFLDYLNAPERSGSLHIPIPRSIDYISRSCFRSIDSYSLEDIRGGTTLSDADFKVRYKELDLGLLDCAGLLWCSVLRTRTPESDDVAATSFVQFGTSGLEKIHAWVMHPLVHWISTPPWISDGNPRYEFVDLWEKHVGRVFLDRIKVRQVIFIAR